MAYNGLSDFLEELAGSGELVRIDADVDPHWEISEITRRVASEGGPALLFERVRGQSMAVLTNLLGTRRRACRLLGIESLDGIVSRIEAVAAAHTPQNWFDRLKMPGVESSTDKFRPRTIKIGGCQQVVHLGRDVNLSTFPLIQSWPDESGASITAGLILTRGAQSFTCGATHCPLVALDENRLALVDDGESAFACHWEEYLSTGERMPAAVVLGGDPAATIAANLALPATLEVLHLVGLLRGKPLDLVKCRTHDLPVPAEAELVFEGYLDPGTPPETIRLAGAGGSHYRISSSALVLHVSAVTHRNRPVFPALVDAGSVGERGVLAKARERTLLAALQAVAPDVTDLSLPLLGGVHRFAFVAFRKHSPFQARQVAAAVWGSQSLKHAKFLVLVDEGVDVHQPEQVWAQVGANVAPERDVVAFDGPADQSDFAGTMLPLARNLALDATTKLTSEHAGTWPAALRADQEIERQVTARWAEFKFELGARLGQ